MQLSIDDSNEGDADPARSPAHPVEPIREAARLRWLWSLLLSLCFGTSISSASIAGASTGGASTRCGSIPAATPASQVELASHPATAVAVDEHAQPVSEPATEWRRRTKLVSVASGDGSERASESKLDESQEEYVATGCDPFALSVAVAIDARVPRRDIRPVEALWQLTSPPRAPPACPADCPVGSDAVTATVRR